MALAPLAGDRELRETNRKLLDRDRQWIGDSFASASSASLLIARSGCVCGTLVSGDISINIDDCFLSSPRIASPK